MSSRRATPLAVATNGAIGGMAGALVLTLIVRAGRGLMGAGGRSPAAPEGAGITAGEVLADAPDLPPDMDRVTATFVQKLATGLFGASLDARHRAVAGRAWHLAYGGFWGMLYALVRASVDLPARALGPLAGIVVWAVGPGWLVPKMRLMLNPSEQRPRTAAMVVAVHAAYGSITALVVHLLDDRARTTARSFDP